ncbi:hypothetical protein [Mycobacteroides abscessus]|uniref:DNA-binding protein n=1 Tax=Mycobacteroides abscessus TaxID=36809 RepID=A0A0U0ZR70_9MYCO|nr:hypothetical protein [Mycobacteroides abscessus]CPV66712.1 Uncharacterised protein [Mycobacteroides abscessus]
MNSPQQRLKLSDAADRCGINADTLKLLAADGLLPQVIRGHAGHIYFPATDVPSWTEVIALLEIQRDRHLRRASDALTRLTTELEAVRNDINEARDHPRQTLGVDLMSFGHWPHDRLTSTLRGQPSITSLLEHFTTERLSITRYHDAYLDALTSHGKTPPEDE